MGHSIRSKKKRAFRAIKRVRYGVKEAAVLEKIVANGTLQKYVQEFKDSKEVAIEGVEEGMSKRESKKVCYKPLFSCTL